MNLRFNAVYFSYPSTVEPVLRELNVEFHEGWTGITGDKGAGKTAFLMLAAGILESQLGKIERAGGIYCPSVPMNRRNYGRIFSAIPGARGDDSHCQQVKKGERYRRQRVDKFYPRISLF
ncbi:MAG: hypothetical protein LBU19_04640 [Treponema sp.]|jgi:energy-coupling factor transporter ATP-binding protein EcfA2|nr:hypothetical protein [Treponema sp.]